MHQRRLHSISRRRYWQQPTGLYYLELFDNIISSFAFVAANFNLRPRLTQVGSCGFEDGRYAERDTQS